MIFLDLKARIKIYFAHHLLTTFEIPALNMQNKWLKLENCISVTFSQGTQLQVKKYYTIRNFTEEISDFTVWWIPKFTNYFIRIRFLVSNIEPLAPLFPLICKLQKKIKN